MVLLLNIAFGLLAGWLADYIMGRARVDNPIRVIIAVIVGVIVFAANLAAQIV